MEDVVGEDLVYTEEEEVLASSYSYWVVET
jgi:hypothetical protein